MINFGKQQYLDMLEMVIISKAHLQDPSRAFTYIDNNPCDEREILNCSEYRNSHSTGHPWFWFDGILLRVSDFK